MMTMASVMVRRKAGDIPHAGETQEAARSVPERAPEQTQLLPVARRRNSFLQRQAQPIQKNPQT
jgi:hypothetical protein